jgi:hypothetical protein
MSIESMARIGNATYQVVLQLGRGSQSFTFQVDQLHGIDVVTWDNDFRELMGGDEGRAKLLFEAILAFHRAQSMSAPP